MNNSFRPPLLARPGSFTLVEVLVAMAVLSIVVVGLAQILSFSMQTWQQGLIRTNCYTKARLVLDAVSADVQRGVFRPDLHNFPIASTSSTPSMPIFTFYTRAAGASTGTATVRPASLVSYRLSSSPGLQGYLLRSENTITWSTTSSNLGFLQQLAPVSAATVPSKGPPNDLLSTGIVDFEMIFLLSDGTTVLAKNYQSPTAAQVVMIGAAVAVIDDQAMTQLQPTTSTDFQKIQTALENAILPPSFSPMTASSGTYTSPNYGRSIKELWDPAMVPLYQSTSYPKSLAIAFQTFERFVPCTPFN